MTEDEARDWVVTGFGQEVAERLDAFVAMVASENALQNLVAPSTIPTIWSRHVVDSLQLLNLSKVKTSWLDIGTGGGFPGLAIALAHDLKMDLVEPRKRRSEFLQACAGRLGIADRVTVHTAKVQNVAIVADVISARAVGTIQNLLRAASHCATKETRWLLPRGRLVEGELIALRKHWRLMFHVEHSVTDPESAIVVLNQVQPK